MISLVFTLAAILIIAAVASFAVDRRRRSTSETVVALPSSPLLCDELLDSTDGATGVAAEDAVSEQPDSLGQGNSKTASAVRPNVATDVDSEVVTETGFAADANFGTEVSTTELGISAVGKMPMEPESVSGIEPGGFAEMPEAAEDAGASETSEAAADLNAGTDVTLRSGAASGAKSDTELGEGPGVEPAESVTAEDADTMDEFKTDLVGDAVATEANSSNAADVRVGAVAGTEFQTASGDNVETGEVSQSSDFAAHTQTTQETNAIQSTEPTQPAQPQCAQ